MQQLVLLVGYFLVEAGFGCYSGIFQLCQDRSGFSWPWLAGLKCWMSIRWRDGEMVLVSTKLKAASTALAIQRLRRVDGRAPDPQTSSRVKAPEIPSNDFPLCRFASILLSAIFTASQYQLPRSGDDSLSGAISGSYLQVRTPCPSLE